MFWIACITFSLGGNGFSLVLSFTHPLVGTGLLAGGVAGHVLAHARTDK